MNHPTTITLSSFSPKPYFSRYQFLLDHFRPGLILDIGNLGGIHNQGISYSSHLAFRRLLGKSSSFLVGLDLFYPHVLRFYPHQIQADVNYPLPFKNESFHTVYLGQILEHLPNPGSLLSQINRIIKPRGRLIIDVPNPYSLDVILKYLLRRQEDLGDPTHLTFLTPASLLAHLAAAGFTLDSLSTKLPSLLKFFPHRLTQGLGSHLLVSAIKTSSLAH